jgi:putative NADH-flavin reductase
VIDALEFGRTAMDQPSLDPFTDILGVDFTPERLEHNLSAFRSVLDEIRKLRALDLTDIHPAVIFEPTAAYRKEPGK